MRSFPPFPRQRTRGSSRSKPPRSRPPGPLDLGRRQRSRQPPRPPGEVQIRGGIVGARPEEREVAEKGSDGRDPPRDSRRGEARRAKVGDVALELVRRDRGGWPAEPAGQVLEVAPIGLD